MRKISSWGLAALLVCALAHEAHAEGTVNGRSTGLGLIVGGGASAVIGGTLLLATSTCPTDAKVGQCGSRADKIAGVVGLIAGGVMLAVGIPLYLTSSPADNGPQAKQIVSGLTAFRVSF